MARGIQSEINHAEVGRVEKVLIEKAARDAGHILGRTRRNKVVAFPGDLEAIGRYGTVTLTSTTGATFRGERVDAVREVAVGSGAAG